MGDRLPLTALESRGGVGGLLDANASEQKSEGYCCKGDKYLPLLASRPFPGGNDRQKFRAEPAERHQSNPSSAPASKALRGLLGVYPTVAGRANLYSVPANALREYLSSTHSLTTSRGEDPLFSRRSVPRFRGGQAAFLRRHTLSGHTVPAPLRR